MWGKISGRSKTVSAGGNFYTGPKSCFMFVVFAFKGKWNYLFRNFVAPHKFSTGTRPEKSIAYNLQ